MLLIGNGLVIPLGKDNQLIENGAVLLEGNLIKEIGLTADLHKAYPDAEFIDAQGRVIMPGFINTHTHIYSALSRGIALKDPPPTVFLEVLQRLWWRLDKALTVEDSYYSALVHTIDSLKNGVTTIVDHQSSPNALKGSLNAIAKANQKIGIRSCLCYEVSDRNGRQNTLDSIQENLDFIDFCEKADNDMLKALFGLHASFTLSDQTLKECRELASHYDIGFHSQAAEGMIDLDDSLQKNGLRVIERLFNEGLLGRKTILAHCIHLNDNEREILKSTDTNVVHCPQSNMNNAVGCADIAAMLNMGITVGLGTDGYTTDMMEEAKVANILQRLGSGNPSAGWGEIEQLLCHNNGKIAEKLFGKPIGRLEKGALADIIVVDYKPFTPLTKGNLWGHMLFGFNGGLVKTTVVNGKIVMNEGKILTIDEDQVIHDTLQLTPQVWERF